MKKQPTKIKNYNKKQIKKLKDRTDYERLDLLLDEDIDYSDISDTNEEFWAEGKIIDSGHKKSNFAADRSRCFRLV